MFYPSKSKGRDACARSFATISAETARVFIASTQDTAVTQARRVRDERINQIVLREIARGIREAKTSLERSLSHRHQVRRILLRSYDADFVYLSPDVTTKWAAAEVRASGRGPDAIERKGLIEEDLPVVVGRSSGPRLSPDVPARRGKPLDSRPNGEA